VQANRKLNETVGGMNILTKDASADRRLPAAHLRRDVGEPVLRQLVLLEQHYETDEVILALAAKKAADLPALRRQTDHRQAAAAGADGERERRHRRHQPARPARQLRERADPR
jgi:hypothetical protein